MRVEVMQYYGLTQALSQAGYYETEHHQQLIKDIKGAVMQGRLIAVCGVVGSGKTVTLRRLQQILKEENRVSVAKSISVEKHSIKLATLISALYYDLSQDKQVQIPKQGERRERELQELVKKGQRPVALFIDEAHDLNGHTLLRRPTMEEIGYRTDIFNLDGIAGSQRDYIHWLLGVCTGNKAELVQTVLSRQLDDLEPTLARHGYRLKDMSEQFDAKAAEIRAMFNNQLEPKRAAEIRERMLAAGLPI